LGNRLGKQVRIVPEIAFFMDDTLERANRIDNILSKLDIPPEEEDEDE
jgi:ribosome-binding factor A